MSDRAKIPYVVVFVFTLEKRLMLAKKTLVALCKTDYPNYRVILFVHTHKPISFYSLNELKQCTKVEVVQLISKSDRGLAFYLNLALLYILKRYPNVTYIAHVEDDAVPTERSWLKVLVKTLDLIPNIAIVMPTDVSLYGEVGYGGILYRNTSFCPYLVAPRSKLFYGIGTGGHCYLARRSYIEELFKNHILPYENIFFISCEDIDFCLKAWIRGHRVACTTLAKVIHEGMTGPKRAIHRTYNAYKNHVLLLVLNFGLRTILTALPFRLLHDLLASIKYREAIPFLRAYKWVIKNLRFVLWLRKIRFQYWKRVKDKNIAFMLLYRVPIPLTKPRST